MEKLFKHLKTISTHKKYVRKLCFKMGIYRQGICHDLSKYSPTELSIAKYYSGTKSPHQNCRDELGYSPSWIHHYHNNKHHYQYWQDQDEQDNNIPLKVPYKYVIEMFCDRVGACKAYNKDKYTTGDALKYYEKNTKGHNVLHKETEVLLEVLLSNLANFESEDKFCEWYKKHKNALKLSYNSKIIEDYDLLGSFWVKKSSSKAL